MKVLSPIKRFTTLKSGRKKRTVSLQPSFDPLLTKDVLRLTVYLYTPPSEELEKKRRDQGSGCAVLGTILSSSDDEVRKTRFLLLCYLSFSLVRDVIKGL